MTAGPAQGVKDPMLLRLWCRPEAATPIRTLAQDLPDATGAAVETKPKTNKQNKNNKKTPKQLQSFYANNGLRVDPNSGTNNSTDRAEAQKLSSPSFDAGAQRGPVNGRKVVALRLLREPW